MSVSVINSGIVRNSGMLLRVLIVLAILFQGCLIVHSHATPPMTEAITQQ